MNVAKRKTKHCCDGNLNDKKDCQLRKLFLKYFKEISSIFVRIIKQFEILDQLKFRKRIRINAKEGKEC